MRFSAARELRGLSKFSLRRSSVARFVEEQLHLPEQLHPILLVDDRMGALPDDDKTLRVRCTDREIDALIDAMASDDMRAVIRRTGRFNWHRSLVLAMVRQPGIKALLVRALFR